MNISTASLTGIPVDVKRMLINKLDGTSLGRLCVAHKSYNVLIAKSQDLWKIASIGDSEPAFEVKDWQAYFTKRAHIRRNMKANNFNPSPLPKEGGINHFVGNNYYAYRNNYWTHFHNIYYGNETQSTYLCQLAIAHGFQTKFSGSFAAYSQNSYVKVYNCGKLILEKQDLIGDEKSRSVFALDEDKLMYQDKAKTIHIWDLTHLGLLLSHKSDLAMTEYLGSIGRWLFCVLGSSENQNDGHLLGINYETHETFDVQLFIQTPPYNPHTYDWLGPQNLDECTYSKGAITISGKRRNGNNRLEVVHLTLDQKIVCHPTTTCETIIDKGRKVTYAYDKVFITQSDKTIEIDPVSRNFSEIKSIKVDGERLFVIHEGIEVWDLTNLTHMKTFSLSFPTANDYAVIDHLLYINNQNIFEVYDLFDLSLLAKIPTPESSNLSFYDGKVISFVFRGEQMGHFLYDLYKPLKTPQQPSYYQKVAENVKGLGRYFSSSNKQP